MSSAFRDIEFERRENQEAREYTAEHDDNKYPAEWGLLVLRYAGRLAEELELCLSGSFDDDDQEWLEQRPREAAVKLAAICVALIERIDRRRDQETQP
jgi:hypothetical protein